MRFLRFIADLAFPVSCVGCGTERTWLCPACAGRVDLTPFRSCPACQKVSTGGRVCGRCRASSPLAGMSAAAPYRDPLTRGLIHGLKYERARSAFPAIAALLRRSGLAARIPPVDLVVPLPLHRRRIHERGFNQAELVADHLASHLAAPLDRSSLVRTKHTPPQAQRRNEERLRNVRGAFAVRKPEAIAGRSVLLVDDVFTTGSTMREAARALREAGAAEVWAAAVAYG